MAAPQPINVEDLNIYYSDFLAVEGVGEPLQLGFGGGQPTEVEPSSRRPQDVEATTADDVTLTMKDGSRVVWGSPDDSDAKAYFASAGLKYDFIISEPTNPWGSGVSRRSAA